MRTAALATTLLLASAAAGTAGPELVDFPAGYEDDFVRYDEIDKPDRKIVRFMYVDPATAAAATPDSPLPFGAVLIMEDHPAELDGETLRRDARGRLIPTDTVTNVFVMEKQASWGADYPTEVRNGEWEYAWFLADGSRRPEAEFTGCFECHKAQADEDYTFSFYPYLRRR